MQILIIFTRPSLGCLWIRSNSDAHTHTSLLHSYNEKYTDTSLFFARASRFKNEKYIYINLFRSLRTSSINTSFFSARA